MLGTSAPVIPTGLSRDSSFLFERMTAETLAASDPHAGRRVLDSAGGLGQDSRALALRGAHAICAEPSRRMAALGRLLDAQAGSAPVWVRAWSEAAYAQRIANAASIRALCEEWQIHFGPRGEVS